MKKSGVIDRLRRITGEAKQAAPQTDRHEEITELRRRIEARVDEMFRRGLVAETEGLLRRGLNQNPTAMQALGYRHFYLVVCLATIPGFIVIPFIPKESRPKEPAHA